MARMWHGHDLASPSRLHHDMACCISSFLGELSRTELVDRGGGLAGVGPYYLARRQRVQGGAVGMAARAGVGDLRCPELVMAGCTRCGSTYLRDNRGGEVRRTRRPAARPGR